MLRLRVLAFACLPFLSAGPLSAETAATKNSPALTPALAPAATTPANVALPNATPSNPTPLNAVPEVKLETTAAADPATDKSATDSAIRTAAADSSVPAEIKKSAAPAAAPVTLSVQIDLSRQTMTVSEDGDATYSWPISSGTSEHPTPRGTFRPQWTAKMWYSRKYDNAPMPNAVFINGGVAIHATPHTRYLGSPASHGCIRLAPTNAATFYRLVHQHGLKSTKVSVYGTPKWRAPAVASRRSNEERARRYAVQQEQNNGIFGFWGSGSSSKKVSAYDSGFVQQRKIRRPVRMAADPYRSRRPLYRVYDGSRIYYVRRPPRGAYYYSNSGYGYGSN